MKRKLLSLLVLLMTAATGAWGDDSGACGLNCTWTLTGSVLTIGGTGEMADMGGSSQPWYGYRNSITSVVVQTGVTKIGSNSLRGLTNMTSLSLPEGLLTIGDNAFNGDNNVSFTSVTIPASVTSIGGHAFQSCTKLATVTFSDGSNLTSIGAYAFSACSSLGSVTIPDGVTSINNNVFANCSSLGSVTIPASVTNIGENAFSGCSTLASVTISDGSNLTSIGNYAFYNCSTLSTFTIPDGVTSIGEFVFPKCSVSSFTIPASVTSIGEGAFYNCSKLTSITVDVDNPNYSSDGGVLFNKAKTTLIQYPIGNTATSYTIPTTVTSIGQIAFSNCTILMSVSIPNGVTSIINEAFQGCSNLTSITVPASMTNIGERAFYNCTSLDNVILNSNPYIGDNAFSYIKNTATVTMNLTANSAGGAKWMTFYNKLYSFEADANTEVFKVALSGTALTLNKVNNGIVDAGTPVVLKTTGGGNPEMTLTADNSSNTDNNNLTGVYDPEGETTDGTFYVLNNGSKGVGFYKLASSKKGGVGKAYLTYSSGAAPSFFGFDGNTTGIDATLVNSEKVNSVVYDLQGRRVAQPTKGLYIVNGKKVVIK